MEPLRISIAQARRIVLGLQGLSDPPGKKLGDKALAGLIARLGFVQIDSIRTVERAHHMILFARNQTYRPEQLRRLVEERRALFEHWTHDASVIPTRFYPYWRARCRDQAAVVEARFQRWHGDAFAREVEPLLELIREQGPVRARDLERPERSPGPGWWDWHAGKAALEFLWRTGRLAIARRDGFQKVYDLPERVIPSEVLDEPVPDRPALIDWACRAALARLGFGTPSELARFFDLITIEEAKAWCAAEAGRALRPLLIEAIDGAGPRMVCARLDLEELMRELSDPPARLRALSPFDPVVRDRARLQRLFGFDYRIEVFVPEARRKYGYYVFPLLERERLIGRLDMRVDRERDVLMVARLWLEPGVRLGGGRQARLEQELDRIRRFVGVAAVELPANLKAG